MIKYDYTVIRDKISGDLPTCSTYKERRANGEGKEWLKLYCGYDTETTTRNYWDDTHLAAVYIFQISLFNFIDDNRVYLMRTWQDFIDSINYLNEYYDLSPQRLLIMGVANLGFEFAFMCRRFEWCEEEFTFFAKEPRKPLICTYGGVQFKEILSISGGSLAFTAKNYTKTQKLKGDLDYDVLRNSTTILDPKTEEQYCINDVVIVSEYMLYLFDRFLSHRTKKLPLTKTAILNDEIKKNFRRQCRLKDQMQGLLQGTSESLWKASLQACFPDRETYKNHFRWLFRGGYVHASALYTDIDLKPEEGRGVRQKDITSSYPTSMLLRYCPGEPFKDVKWDPKYLKSHCCIIHARFLHIKNTTVHTIESRSKLVDCIGGVFDNGRLARADMVEVYLTEMDFKNYEWFYSWEEMQLIDFKIAKRRAYPSYFTDVIKYYYLQKARLKKEGKNDTKEYSVSKEMVNSAYGLTVKRMREDKHIYKDHEWQIDSTSFDYDKEVKRSVLLPYYGMWVSSASRHELLKVVHNLTKAGVQVVYCDTDSVKYIADPAAERIFKRYNKMLARQLITRGLRASGYKGLGQFEDETKGKETRFKTLGAKRYIYQVGDKIKATIAGMPKVSIKHIAKNKDGNEVSNADMIFDAFNACGFVLTALESDKLTTCYTDKPYDMYIEGEWMHEESGVALYKIPFTMRLKDEYTEYFNEIQEELRNKL